MRSYQCENCGNIYDKAFTILIGNDKHVFDCFECAINKIAPHCTHCDTRIIGHGLEEDGYIFCCANCARHERQTTLKDRVNPKESPVVY